MKSLELEAFSFDTPQKPKSLKMLEILKQRKNLIDDDRRELNIQKKGYEGERAFASLVRQFLPPDALVLYSLLLKTDNNYFQIDCLIILRGKIYMMDLKNYQHPYVFYEDGFRLLKNDRKIGNPLHQLERCEDLFRDFVARFQVHHQINAFVIFIHPDFLLYQAPLNFNLIFSSQVPNFLEKIAHASLKPQASEIKIANHLRENHVEHNPFEYIPKYYFRELRKGILCLHCTEQMEIASRVGLHCSRCGKRESLKSGVLRSVVDFQMLFPDRKVVTKTLFDWFGGIISRKIISRILQLYMKKIGSTKATYYEFY